MSNSGTPDYELASVRALQRARKTVVDGEVPDSARFLVEMAAVYATLELADAIRGGTRGDAPASGEE